MQEIMDLLDVNNNPFPSHLTLDEQGIFVLGYYHQRADFYKSKNNQAVVESIQAEEIS
jgi:CRISPR-associated protein Csd1